ncbi:MAG: sodium:proton antiporter [bacterium]
MKKVLIFSILLLLGLAGSQVLPGFLTPAQLPTYQAGVKLLTMFCLGFIMIHVGYEFEIDKARVGQYGKDYLIAATAAGFPWIFCALYFVLVMNPSSLWGDWTTWKESLLSSRFAAPTSAGILFSMLAAAGLSATWVYRKARILAIFDDLDTVLLMIPLKMMMVGLRWQLAVIVVIMAVLLYLAWRFLHRWRLPVAWPFVALYAALVTGACEALYLISLRIDDVVPIHIEVLLPAFVLGCILARPPGAQPHADDAREGHQEGPETPGEQRVSTLISALFMVLVGLSMPAVAELVGSGTWPGWGNVMLHVLVVTLLANLGKMFPLFCYRQEVDWRQRLALCIGMWPRGEVGAGVLVVSLSYGIGGAPIAVAMLSLALNLVLTGIFIVFVKRLLAKA